MPPTVTVTVLFTDIVGSTDLLVRLGEQEWEDLRQRHVEGQRAVVAEHHGTEVKNTGDGLMVMFSGVADAVRCALALHGRSSQVVADGSPIGLRIGLATGDATADGADWFGPPVVEAARLCALAGRDQTLATAIVAQLAGTRPPARFSEPERQHLKGLGEVAIVEVEPVGGPVGTMYADVEASQAIAHRLVAQLDFWDSVAGMSSVQDHGLAELELAPGQTVCDVGCGTGARLRRLAELVGATGTVIGIDPSPAMVEEARRRTAGHPGPVQLEVRDGRDTGLPDGCCDGVLMERVAQHVGDLETFLAEARRITRPGGRIAYIDTDWGSMVIDPGDPALVRRVSARMGLGPMAEPWAGRTLLRTMVDGGLESVTSRPFVLSAGAGAVPVFVRVMAREVEAGRITQEEIDRFEQDLTDAGRRGSLTLALTMFVAAGTVPGG